MTTMGMITQRKAALGALAAAAVTAGSVAGGLATADEQPVPGQPGTCKTVAHVGDSTSLGMTDPQVIPDEQNQLPAKYKTVAGAETTIVDAVGGRAIIEQVGDASTGLDAVRAVVEKVDCLVVALGTNDAANEAVGSSVKADQRIDQVMALAAGKPVLWPTVKTTEAAASVNGYAPAGMTAFNDALVRAAERFQNLWVLKWADEAEDGLFTGDGIHYTAEGTQKRIDAFAGALKQMSEGGPPASTPAAPPSTTSPVVPSSPAAADTSVPQAPATVTETVTVTVTAPAPTPAS